jgi:hypothetical protein
VVLVVLIALGPETRGKQFLAVDGQA